MKIVSGICDVCGEEAKYKTRISPQGYLISKESELIEYNSYIYCSKHYDEIMDMLWGRLMGL